MTRIRWAGPALDDLRDIRAWIARESRQYAENTVRGIRRATSPLKRFPEMGRVVPEFATELYREVFHGPYRVIYRYDRDADVVTIEAVVHGSRLLRQPPGGG